MSEIYRCGACDQTASEWMWDESTEQYLRDRFDFAYEFTKIKDVVTYPESHRNGYRYKCPYCGKQILFGDMTNVQKIKVERASHLEEDLFKI